MLTHLSIHNYALINQLTIDFTNGLSIITGETGAGKSILLGALGLVMGNRADLTALKNTEKKCVIEAQFSVEGYALQELFKELDLDYEQETIIRREILPSGKSRAFVNDTPVTLSILNALKTKLIDIHSQHQTMQLSDVSFQFSVIDALAKNQAKIASYKRGLRTYNKLRKELKVLQEETEKSKEQYEYNLHLFNEFEEANLKEGEQEVLEEKLDKLNNIEEIKLNLSEALGVSINEEIGIQTLLNSLESKLQKISSFSKQYEELANRVTSVKIELDDVVTELESANEEVEFNPNEIEELNDRLQLIYNLQKKHSVSTISELQEIHASLSEKVAQVEDAGGIVAQKEAEIKEVAKKLDDVAKMITTSRNKVIPKLKKELEYLLSELGMPNARFAIELLASEEYLSNGKDNLQFLFSANKGGDFGELKKVASGGELSRIMLSIKKILSEKIQLPTIIFDEIDTGVSGEVSNKIAKIMQDMSAHMQVITITHLPQIASKGVQHYKVFKGEEKGVTTSNLKLLSEDERIREIAEMLSGKDVSESALIHAKELLN
ncbi:DNA replication and repair protein RecN [Tenacibaculum mesophilum]|uniref:DNA repair protein RecN n=1 Tax=Tenacibaculum mesophilum TaxID=104268 RepID=A0ABN5T227_9FLAO|nr:DNA repair protein RecN [Tenacibaculum mesophilum]AZJ31306.1 DNA repair protein RecN [Tenacibaculum mesophilum]QFS29354.1 DNA repair protein RecN [Tenacibaculum mesophilum]SHF48193.1 DNA replication and repair protein RecN [Tenacibaculum mesophilum]